MPKYWGAIEAGGTKWNCMVAAGPEDILDEERFPTTTPEETLGQAIQFFNQHRPKLLALGVASFGPVDLNKTSPTYGYITTTPKPGWQQTDVVGALKTALELPIAFDTDVNGAALGEHKWGAAQSIDDFIYITVGTGIGGGAVSNGQLVHGLLHPEMGHMRLPHDIVKDPFEGICPYHRDCFEGLANGPAIAARWGQPAETLPPKHEAWSLQAHYLALACMNLILLYSPQRIILGGGVMEQSQLFPLIHQKTQELLNDYLQSPVIRKAIASYIVPPGLGSRAGVLGALALARSL